MLDETAGSDEINREEDARLTTIDETSIVLREGDLSIARSLEVNVRDARRLAVLVVRELDARDGSDGLREEVLQGWHIGISLKNSREGGG